MKSPAKTLPASGMRSWHDIGQGGSRRPLSPVAWRKRFAGVVRIGSTLLLGVSLLTLVVWSLAHMAGNAGAGGVSGLSSPLQTVSFKTDGVLDETWAREFLHLRAGEPLQGYDIYALQRRLLESKQIREASVERVLPGTLKIQIKERRPWLRIAADDGKGGYEIFLVARDGTLFESFAYLPEALGRLPWLAGVTLRRAPGGGFLPVGGMDRVVDLLAAARANVPQLAEQWTVVDLSQYDLRPQAPLSLIKVRSRDFGELLFAPSDFSTQIDRLAITAHTLQERHVQPARLDLSLQNQVVVKPVSLPPVAASSKRSAGRTASVP